VVEYASPGSLEFEEIIEEYLEVLEPLATNTFDTAPA
jgi:hypothetical protein